MNEKINPKGLLCADLVILIQGQGHWKKNLVAVNGAYNYRRYKELGWKVCVVNIQRLSLYHTRWMARQPDKHKKLQRPICYTYGKKTC